MSVRLQVVMEIPGKDPREFEYEFDQDRISMGRDEDNDIQIPLSTVSRHHAQIYREGEEWFIEDNHSTHGTKHNGRQLGAGGKKLLRNGDEIELIHFRIAFSSGAALSEDYSSDRTEALAQKMVLEVLANMGTDSNTPFLRVMNGPDEGTRFELGPNISEVVVGRGTDCDFQINDANISRRHAVVRRDWSDITIEDLGSKNGVVINEKKIQGKASLRDADEILLGAVRLTFIDPSAKFIGKLDDIPAFQEPQRAEPDGDDDSELEEEPEAEAPAAVEAAPPSPGDGGEEGPLASMEGPPDLGLEAGLPDGEPGDDVEGESDGEDGEATAGQGLGAFEYSMIALATLVIIGLGVGVFLLFF